MAWMTPPKLAEVKFHRYTTKDLAKQPPYGVDELLRQSLAIDFPKRNHREREELVTEARRTRANPNKGVGGVLMQKRQAYARPLAVTAFVRGELVAYLPAADNASSSKHFPGVLGAPIRHAKLHSAEKELHGHKLINSRYMWFGLVAFNDKARNLQAQSAVNEVNLLDIMAILAADQFDGRQPGSTYPYIDGDNGERAWEAAALGMGFEPVPDADVLKHPFGEYNKPVTQHSLRVSSVSHLRETIEAKAGSELITAARAQVHEAAA